jgi:hypothetical protein
VERGLCDTVDQVDSTSEGISRFNEHVVDRDMQSGWNTPGASIMMVRHGWCIETPCS